MGDNILEVLDIDKLSLFIIFFVPGFISNRVWTLIIPSVNNKLSDYVLETISYSCINFAVMFGLIKFISKPEFQINHAVWFYVLIFIILLIMPIIWPLLIAKLLNSEFLRGHVIQPMPKSWDYFFGKAESCYVLIHLKNTGLIGGLYNGNSFASSFPYKEDIYIEEVWNLNEKGEFISKIDNSKGMWICKDFFNYIEFFEIIYEEEN